MLMVMILAYSNRQTENSVCVCVDLWNFPLVLQFCVCTMWMHMSTVCICVCSVHRLEYVRLRIPCSAVIFCFWLVSHTYISYMDLLKGWLLVSYASFWFCTTVCLRAFCVFGNWLEFQTKTHTFFKSLSDIWSVCTSTFQSFFLYSKCSSLGYFEFWMENMINKDWLTFI